jgi:asparagine synthase (glutamine-hydrolysing)
MLSGGIDSVVVLAIASKVLGLDLVAFTFNYEDYSGRYNEGPAARVAASALGVEHTDIAIGPAFVMENLPRLIEAYEEPTTYGLHSAHMEPIADVGIDVALSGADAPFLNMPGPLAWALRIGALVPKPMLVAAGRLTTGIQMGIARRANTLLTMASAGMAHQYLEFPLHKVVPRPLARTLYQDPDLEELSSRELEDHLSEEMATEGLSSRDKLVLAGLSGSASEHVLTWNHRWGQLAGISVRFPLCDHDFVAYMSRRTMGTPGKEDLRMLAVEFLPDEVVAAPKIPQTIPLDLWFRGPMKDYMREQLDRELIAEEGTFVPEVIEECLDEHIAGRANHKWAVWSTLTYLVWRKHVLDV